MLNLERSFSLFHFCVMISRVLLLWFARIITCCLKKMLDKIRRKEVVRVLVIALAAGFVIPAIFIAPGSVSILKLFATKKFRAYDQKEIRSALRMMQREKLIAVSEQDNHVRLTLTAKGKKRNIIYNIDTISLNSTEKWDGIWRIVSFDIPEKLTTSRNIFREKLKSLGFKQLQKSIWITQYRCYDQVIFLINVLEIDKYIALFETKKINTAVPFYYP